MPVSAFSQILIRNRSRNNFFQVHNHGNDVEALHNFIEPKYLPKRYGGIRPDYPYREWFKNLSKNPKIVEGKPTKLYLD